MLSITIFDDTTYNSNCITLTFLDHGPCWNINDPFELFQIHRVYGPRATPDSFSVGNGNSQHCSSRSGLDTTPDKVTPSSRTIKDTVLIVGKGQRRTKRFHK